MSFSQAPGLPYSKLGIPEDDDTASRAISKGKYVIWKGKNYFAKTDILQGETFVEDTNLTEIPDGALNGIVDELGASVVQLKPKFYLVRIGKMRILTCSEVKGSDICAVTLNPMDIPSHVVLLNINRTNSEGNYVAFGYIRIRTTGAVESLYNNNYNDNTGWTINQGDDLFTGVGVYMVN